MLPPLQGLSLRPVAEPTGAPGDARKRRLDDDPLDVVYSPCPAVRISRCHNPQRIDAVNTLFANTHPEYLDGYLVRERCQGNQPYNTLKPVAVFDIVHNTDNGSMLADYASWRDRVSVDGDVCNKYGPFLECARTDQIDGLTDRSGLGPLRSWINEKYLVHGLPVSSVEPVLQSSCDPTRTTVSMYSPNLRQDPNYAYNAFYQGEEVGKSDQYCTTNYGTDDAPLNAKLKVDVRTEIKPRTYYMFVTRTILGCANHIARHTHRTLTDEYLDLNDEPSYQNNMQREFVEPYDSLIVEHGEEVRGGYTSGNIPHNTIPGQNWKNSGFREFIVQRSSQVLPVMLVAYVRVMNNPPPRFDHKRLECFYPIAPAIPTLLDQLRAPGSVEEHEEATKGLEKLVPQLFLQLDDLQFKRVPDTVSITAQGREIRVANAGLLRLLPSLAALMRLEPFHSTDANRAFIALGNHQEDWFDQAVDVLLLKYLSLPHDDLQNVVLLREVVEEGFVPLIVALGGATLDDNKRTKYLMMLEHMTEPWGDAPVGYIGSILYELAKETHGKVCNLVAHELMQKGWKDLASVLRIGAPPQQVSAATIIQHMTGYTPQRHLTELINKEFVTVRAVYKADVIPVLLNMLSRAAEPPNPLYDFNNVPEFFYPAEVVAKTLTGLITGFVLPSDGAPADAWLNMRRDKVRDEIVDAGGVEVLVHALDVLAALPRLQSQKSYDARHRARVLEVLQDPAMDALVDTLHLLLPGRANDSSKRLVAIPELRRICENLTRSKFSQHYYLEGFVVKFYIDLLKDNYLRVHHGVDKHLIGISVLELAPQRFLVHLSANQIDDYVKILLPLINLGEPEVQQRAKALTKVGTLEDNMVRVLIATIPDTVTMTTNEIRTLTSPYFEAWLKIVRKDANRIQRLVNSCKAVWGGKEIEELIKKYRYDGYTYFAPASALLNEVQRMQERWDKKAENIDSKAQLLMTWRDQEVSQLVAIEALPQLLGSGTTEWEIQQNKELFRNADHDVKGHEELRRLFLYHVKNYEWDISQGYDLTVTESPRRVKGLLRALTAACTDCHGAGFAVMRDQAEFQHGIHDLLNGKYGDEESTGLAIEFVRAVHQVLIALVRDAPPDDDMTSEIDMLAALAEAKGKDVHNSMVEHYAIAVVVDKIRIRPAAKCTSNELVAIARLLNALATDNEWAMRWMLDQQVAQLLVTCGARYSRDWLSLDNKHNRNAHAFHYASLVAKLAAPGGAKASPEMGAQVELVNPIMLSFLATYLYPLVKDIDHIKDMVAKAVFKLTYKGRNKQHFLMNDEMMKAIVRQLIRERGFTETTGNFETAAYLMETLNALLRDDTHPLSPMYGVDVAGRAKIMTTNPDFNKFLHVFADRPSLRGTRVASAAKQLLQLFE